MLPYQHHWKEKVIALCISLAASQFGSSNGAHPVDGLTGRVLAGKGTQDITGAGCGSSPVQWEEPLSMTVSPDGSFFILDRICQRVTRYSTMPQEGDEGVGEIVIPGNPAAVDLRVPQGGYLDNLRFPRSIFYDSALGDIIITDVLNHRILRWKPGAFSSTLLIEGTPSDSNGDLHSPSGVFVVDNMLYTIEDINHRVQQFDLAVCCDAPDHSVAITLHGCPNMITGTGRCYAGYDIEHLDRPQHISVTSDSVIYIADTYNHRIIRYIVNGTATQSFGVNDTVVSETMATIVAGTSGIPGCNPEQLRFPHGTAVDSDGFLYVADTGNHRVQKFAPASGVRVGITVAGECCCPRTSVDGSPVGGSELYQLSTPKEVALDPLSGTLLVLDQGNHRVIAFNMTESPTSLGGSCAYGVECSVLLTGQIRSQGGQLLIAHRVLDIPAEENETNVTSPCGSFFCAMPTWPGLSHPVAAKGPYLDTFSFGVPRGPLDNASLAIGGEFVLCWGRSPSTPCVGGFCGGHDNCSNSSSWLCAGVVPWGVKRKVWINIPGETVDSLRSIGDNFPEYPDLEEALTNDVATPTNWAENYGQQLTGLFVAPETGLYTFHITSDHNSELWISDTWNETGQLVAYISQSSIRYDPFQKIGFASGPDDWTAYPTQSGNFEMEAGQIYMVDVLHKEGTGPDFLRVGVTLPSGSILKPMPVSLFEAKTCKTGLPEALGVIHDCTGVVTGQTCIAECQGGFVGAREIFHCNGLGILMGVVPVCTSVTCLEYDVEVGRFFMHGVVGQAPEPSVCLDCTYTTAGNMPFGVAMDNDGYVITVDSQHHVVARWWGDRSQVLAGGHGAGTGLDQLYWPNGVFYVSGESPLPSAIYIADMYNHRIVRWYDGNLTGEVVFGTGAPGDNLTSLYYPSSVYVDRNGTMYIQDFGNKRIMRVLEGMLEGEVAEEKDPFGLSMLPASASDSFFDGRGNYFSADYGGHSITACVRRHSCSFSQCGETTIGAVYGGTCGCMTTMRCAPGFGALPGGVSQATTVLSPGLCSQEAPCSN